MIVELQDLSPVGGVGGPRVAVNGLYRSLDLVGAGLVALQAAPHDGLALGHEPAVPQATVLIGQEHEIATRAGAGGATRVHQQHQRQEAQDLRLLGHQVREDPFEANGLGAEVLAEQPIARGRGVALVEDQVHDGQHGAEAGVKVRRAGDPIRDLRVADLPFRPDESLGHRRLRDEEGARDLRGGEPSEQPQRQSDLRAGGERGVAAGEDEPQSVVAHGALLGELTLGVRQDSPGVTVLSGGLPAQAVDRAVARGRDDPARRAGR